MKPLSKWGMRGIATFVAIAAVWAGVEFGRWSRTPSIGTESHDAITRLLAAPLTTPEGQPQTLGNWGGKVLVVNFWATWCPPCREEMPEFSRSQDKYGPNGVQFVGIAIDNAANVAEFIKTTPVAYPLLLGSETTPDLMVQLGNRQQVLPFTIIIGRNNELRFSHLGPLSEPELAKQLAPLLQ